MGIELCLAVAADAAGVADIYLASRKTFVPFAPLAHGDAEIRQWIADVLIAGGRVTVATRDGVLVGMMGLSHDANHGWINHLYLDPSAVGRGIGSQLVALAKQTLKPPIRLYCFQENVRALRFYERHGFRAIAFGDGQANEERCPDALLEWGSADEPLAPCERGVT